MRFLSELDWPRYEFRGGGLGVAQPQRARRAGGRARRAGGGVARGRRAAGRHSENPGNVLGCIVPVLQRKPDCDIFGSTRPHCISEAITIKFYNEFYSNYQGVITNPAPRNTQAMYKVRGVLYYNHGSQRCEIRLCLLYCPVSLLKNRYSNKHKNAAVDFFV